MFVRDHLAVVSHWAKDQLREGADSTAVTEQLQQLIEAADALRAALQHAPQSFENVIQLNDFRRAVS